RVMRSNYAFSPTAFPNGYAIFGADTSGCQTRVWKDGPYPRDDFLVMYPFRKVRKGIGQIHVVTYVPDENTGNIFNGLYWYARGLRKTFRYSRRAPAVPDFGLKHAYGGLFAPQIVGGIWQDGDDGVIEIEVYAHSAAVKSLRRAASLIVPNFDSDTRPRS